MAIQSKIECSHIESCKSSLNWFSLLLIWLSFLLAPQKKKPFLIIMPPKDHNQIKYLTSVPKWSVCVRARMHASRWNQEIMKHSWEDWTPEYDYKTTPKLLYLKDFSWCQACLDWLKKKQVQFNRWSYKNGSYSSR